MKRKAARVFLISALLVWGGLSIGCGPSRETSRAAEQETQVEALDAILARGVLRVGVEAEDYSPHHFRLEDGRWDGFEIALVKKLADNLKIDVEIIPTNWDMLITELLNGTYDIIASSLSKTPKREILPLRC